MTCAKSWSRLSARSGLQKASGLLRSPQATRTSLHSCAEQPDRQDFAKSSLPACPVLLRCRSARKLFLPDLLRRMVSSWCALVVAVLLRKSILTCSRSCCCQGTILCCKKSKAFKNASKTVFESGSYTYSILKRVFGNLIFKFCLENFLHQYESIGPFWNTILDKKKNGKVRNRTLPFWGMLHSSTVLFVLVYYFITAFSNV